MSKAFLLIFFFGAASYAEVPGTPADQVRLDLRWEQSPTFDDRLDQTVQYRHRFKPWFEMEGAVRVAETFVNLNSLQYKAQADFPLCRFFSFSTRFTQSIFLDPNFSTTHLGFLGNVDVPILSAWHFLISGGYFFRFVRLQNAAPLPFFDASFSERHWMALLGTWVSLSDRMKLYGWMGTYETLDIFNFHNPYGTLSLHYKTENAWEWMAYARYRILLGFGMRDSFLAGVGVAVPIETVTAHFFGRT